MLDQIVQIGREWKRLYALDRCGIGFGGPVQFTLQRVHQSTHVGGWHDFALPKYIDGTLRIPSIMDNDANVGALGEHDFGAGRGASNFVYMTLSTGIGGGIVIGGDLYRGADCFAGELGHMTIRPDGPECLCGSRGCFERMCCGLWLERDYGKPASVLMQDPAFVRTYVCDLALGLKNVIMLLNPERIVIGGGISKAGPALFGPLREELRRQITAWSHARIDVQPSLLADDSVLYGAHVLADQI
jgi:glucokinase